MCLWKTPLALGHFRLTQSYIGKNNCDRTDSEKRLPAWLTVEEAGSLWLADEVLSLFLNPVKEAEMSLRGSGLKMAAVGLLYIISGRMVDL